MNKSTKEPHEFGAEVRRRREAQNITLEVLAARSGLTPNYIGGIELGRREPSLSSMFALAKGLGVPLGELLGGAGDASPAALEIGREFDALTPDEKAAILMLLRALLGREPEVPRTKARKKPGR